MATILALVGSLRQRSYNGMLARAAVEVTPSGSTMEVASIRGIPLYDGDVEEHGIPPEVEALKARVMSSDGLLLVTPEYNHSIPGVFKNTIDWLSRPAEDIPRVFGDRPTGMIGATTSQGGTRFAQVAWLPVLSTLGVRPFSAKSVFLAEARKAFDPQGKLTDDKLRKVLSGYIAAFVEFIDTKR